MTKLFSAIRDRLRDQRETRATSFKQLVEQVVNEEDVDADRLVRSLDELGKCDSDLERAVKLVQTFRRYEDTLRKAGLERRAKLPPLDSTPASILEFVAYFENQIERLKDAAERDAIDAKVSALQAELEAERQRMREAEARWASSRKKLEEPLRQAESNQSRILLSIEQSARQHPPKSDRLFELEREMRSLIQANIESLQGAGFATVGIGNSDKDEWIEEIISADEICYTRKTVDRDKVRNVASLIRQRVEQTGFSDPALRERVKQLSKEIQAELDAQYESI